MNFMISCSELNKALKVITPAIKKNTILPILENFKIVREKGKATVVATDLNLSIITKVEVEAVKDFDVVIPFKLHNLVSPYKTGIAEFSVSKEEGVVVVINGKKFKVGGFEDEKNYPTIRGVSDDAAEIEVDDVVLSKMVDACACVGTDLTSPYQDVGIQIKGGKITIASTDRLLLFKFVDFVNDKKLNATVAVPVSFVHAVSDLSDSKMSMEEGKVKISNDNTVYIGTTTEQQTPFDPIEQILSDAEPNCIIDKSVLNEAINDILNYGTILPFVDFFFEKDVLKLSFVDADFDYHFDASIDLKHSVEAPQVRFNAKQLKKVVDLCDDEEVQLCFPDSGYSVKTVSKDGSTKMAIQSIMI